MPCRRRKPPSLFTRSEGSSVFPRLDLQSGEASRCSNSGKSRAPALRHAKRNLGANTGSRVANMVTRSGAALFHASFGAVIRQVTDCAR
jgi:hypothetical protein